MEASTMRRIGIKALLAVLFVMLAQACVSAGETEAVQRLRGTLTGEQLAQICASDSPAATAAEGLSAEELDQLCSRRVRRDPSVIVAEELADYSTMMLADAIRQLRPRWMNARGAPSVEFGGDRRVPVVLDGGAPQDWGILDSLRPDQVQSVRFHSAADATMRWGTGFPNGLIEVLTMRGGGS
jgi:hypothetical protein